MGTFSAAHWLVVLAVVLIVFGPGRLAAMMGELGKAIRGFRNGLAEDETALQPIPVKVDRPRDHRP